MTENQRRALCASLTVMRRASLEAALAAEMTDRAEDLEKHLLPTSAASAGSFNKRLASVKTGC